MVYMPTRKGEKTVSLPQTADPTVPFLTDRGLEQFNRPRFDYCKTRFSTFRTEMNVSDVAREWTEHPNRVVVFEDPKLKEVPLVTLRKDQFEKMLKILNDLESGQATLATSFEALFHQINIIERSTAEALKKLKNPPMGLENIQDAVRTLIAFKGRITSTLLVQKSKRKVEPSTIPDEELADQE